MTQIQPKKVSDATFTADVLDSDIPVLVDFWAEWCQPCHLVAPILDEIAAEQDGKLRIGKVNIDENPQTSEQYQVKSIPFMALFKGGALVTTVIGAQPKAAIWRQIAEYLE